MAVYEQYESSEPKTLLKTSLALFNLFNPPWNFFYLPFFEYICQQKLYSQHTNVNIIMKYTLSHKQYWTGEIADKTLRKISSTLKWRSLEITPAFSNKEKSV